MTTLAALRRWWWLPCLLAILGGFGAFSLYKQTSALYQAEAYLEISAELSSDRFSTTDETREFISTLTSLLKSRQIISEVVEHDTIKGNSALYSLLQQPSLTSDVLRHEAAVTTVLNGLLISRVDDSRVMSIQFSSTDPVLARNIPNLLAEKTIAQLEARKETTLEQAREANNANIKTAKERLSEAEQAVLDFNKSLGLDAFETAVLDNAAQSDPENIYALQEQELLTLNAELTNNQIQLMDQEYQYSVLLQGPDSIAFRNQPVVLRLKARLEILEKEYDEKSQLFKPDYPDMVVIQNNIEDVKEELDKTYQKQLANMDLSREATQREQETLSRRINQLRASMANLRANMSRYKTLLSAVDVQRQVYQNILLDSQEDLTNQDKSAARLSLLDKALLPQKPYTIKGQTVWAGSATLGFVLGLLCVFITTQFNNKIVSPDDLPTRLNLRTLGVVPKLSASTKIWDELMDPLTPMSEAYATACSNLRHAGFGRDDYKCLQVTSTRPGEGKSATSLSLAKTFAGIGSKTVLVDADLRLPSFSSAKVPPFNLSNYLQEGGDANSLAKPIFIDNMFVIQVGEVPTNPSGLIASARFSELITLLKREFDIIILDGPPVLGLSDALDLSAHADATVFVVQSNALNSDAVRSSLMRLGYATQNIIGGIMTKYKPRNDNNYYYTQYSYGSRSTDYGNYKKKKDAKSAAIKGLELF